MLWAGAHPGRQKLEEAREIARDQGPSPCSSPGSPRPTGYSLFGAHSASGRPRVSSPAPCPRHLNASFPENCSSLHFVDGDSLKPALDLGPAPSESPFQDGVPWDPLRERQTLEWMKIKRNPTQAGTQNASTPVAASLTHHHHPRCPAQAIAAGATREEEAEARPLQSSFSREAADGAGEGASPAAVPAPISARRAGSGLAAPRHAGEDLGPKPAPEAEERWWAWSPTGPGVPGHRLGPPSGGP
ncbi:uncharacterized protein LOC119543276 [Choloepus didactylus]|uniref:uncharacterized protein LOC119543276 n=1 Tax=Choloepus didactylus TaxID=27675 RepID=UPI00189F8F76|nr:uncharacterized protein LOC119543276 [Choloepus didactylus]